MKPSLRLKILILLGYVALCTALLVWGDQQAEPPAAGELSESALRTGQ